MDWEAQDWAQIVPRLLLYATGLVSRMVWRGQYGGSPPGGLQPEDFVYTAINKTMTGVRRIDVDGDVTLFQYLAGVVRSDINACATSSENKTTSLDPQGRDALENVVPIAITEQTDPLTNLQGQQDEEEVLRLLDFLRKEDPQLSELASCLLVHEFRGSVELCNELRISIKELNNLKKRLRRKVNVYRRCERAANG